MKTMPLLFLMAVITALTTGCDSNSDQNEAVAQWQRHENNPVLRDIHGHGGYQSASDPHVVVENGQLYMFYSGDVNDYSGIKLAKGSDWATWEKHKTVVVNAPDDGDLSKETVFYRESAGGKHQLYYIGYEDEDTYTADIYLAEADHFEGPYTRLENPVVPRGILAGKEAYCFTSPSVIEHDNKLYMAAIAWNDKPAAATDVWVIRAISEDNGHTRQDFQIANDIPIGMEGQITKTPSGGYVAVSTGEYNNAEAVYYATANHPFGPWQKSEEPILIQAGAPYEVTELIAPQITFDPETGKPYLYYTGADQEVGWWVMLATKD